MQVNKDFWRNKRVLVTGHTGFKGYWLTLTLHELGADILGVGLDMVDDHALSNQTDLSNFANDIRLDITNFRDLEKKFLNFKPEIVFHLAAQAIVVTGYEQPLKNFNVNIMGTVNILECIRNTPSVMSGVIVTTDKVYKNESNGTPFKESDAIGSEDPYSASKAACEIVFNSYLNALMSERKSRFVSVRAGNVIGGGDWGSNRLIPDLMRYWFLETPIQIRNPSYTRPWQHVMDPINAYLLLAELAFSNKICSQSFNIGPECEEVCTVAEVVTQCAQVMSAPVPNFQKSITTKNYKEAKLLSLDCSEIYKKHEIYNQWNVTRSIYETASWYRDYFNGVPPDKLTKNCIRDYLEGVK